jgi:hypothetical protein
MSPRQAAPKCPSHLIIQKKRRYESLRRAGKLFLSTNYAATSSSTAAM